jgi:hypothetical protein
MRTLEFGDGAKVITPDRPTELSRVKLIDKRGNEKEELWGTVVAMTNGAVLELLGKQP